MGGFLEDMTDSDDVATERGRIEAALRRASNLTIRRHRALGLPLVVVQDQRIVHLDPASMREIPPGELEEFIARAKASWDDK